MLLDNWMGGGRNICLQMRILLIHNPYFNSDIFNLSNVFFVTEFKKLTKPDMKIHKTALEKNEEEGVKTYNAFLGR